MNQMKPTHELKASAKEQLLGTYKIIIPAILIVSLFSFILNNLAASIYSDNSGVFSFLLYLIFSLLSAVLLRYFSIGKSYLFLNLVTNRNIRLNDIYHGFKMSGKRTFPLCGIYVLVTELTLSLPIYFFGEYYGLDASSLALIGITVFLLVGIICFTYFVLSFSQVFYLANDFPNLTAPELYKLSHKLMKTNKGKLLYLYISFIPWILLSILTFGIALLWISSYIETTKTLFYLDLIDSKKNK